MIKRLLALLLLFPALCFADVNGQAGPTVNGQAGATVNDANQGGTSPCTIGNSGQTSTATHIGGVMQASISASGACGGSLVTGHYYNGAAVAKTAMLCVYIDDADSTFDIGDNPPIACTEQKVVNGTSWGSLTFSSGTVLVSTNYFIGVVLTDAEAGGTYGYSVGANAIYRTVYSDGVCDPFDMAGAINGCTITNTASRTLSAYITVQP
jgi:hypothetical protein